MARRGFGGTALRAALGAVTGVAEGLQQRDTRAVELGKEKAAQQRQAMYDALALADRGALPVAQGRLAGQQAMGEVGKAALSAMNLAGGGGAIQYNPQAITAGAPFMGSPATFNVGGVDYAVPNQDVRRTTRDATELAADLRKRQLMTEQDQKARDVERTTAGARVQQLVKEAKGKPRNSAAALQLLAEYPKAYEGLYPQPDPGAALRLSEAQAEREQREVMGLAYLKQNPDANTAYVNLSKNPRYAKMSPGAIGYALMEQNIKTTPRASQLPPWTGLLGAGVAQQPAQAASGGSLYQQYQKSGGVP